MYRSLAAAQAHVRPNQRRFETSRKRCERLNGCWLKASQDLNATASRQRTMRTAPAAGPKIIPLYACAAPIKCRVIVMSSPALTGDYGTTKEPLTGCFTPQAECINVSNLVRRLWTCSISVRPQGSLLLYGYSTFETRSMTLS